MRAAGEIFSPAATLRRSLRALSVRRRHFGEETEHQDVLRYPHRSCLHAQQSVQTAQRLRIDALPQG